MFDGEPKPDLLILEFAYNDCQLPPSAEKDTETTTAPHVAANYERIIRRALTWGTASTIVEFAALDRGTLFPSASAGSAHAVVALRYGVPIVDLAYFLSFWPKERVQTDFYGPGEFIHPHSMGHVLAASLLMQELDYHVGLLTRHDLSPAPDSGFTPSWMVRPAGRFHGYQPPRERPADLLLRVPSDLPQPLFVRDKEPLQCLSSRLNNPEEFQSAVENSVDFPCKQDLYYYLNV